MPTVSVITPTYNRADVLERALDSVQCQTLTDAEHIIVDDGSTDATPKVVADYNETSVPVRYEQLNTNQGAPAARNHGLARAEGEYLAFLDSDDEYLPNSLERMVAAIDERYVGVTHQSIIVDQNGVEYTSASPIGEITLDRLRDGNPIGTLSSTLFTRNIVEEVGGFDTDFPASQDYDLYIRVLGHGPMIGLEATLSRYHRREDAISTSPKRKKAAQKLIWEKHDETLSEDLRARQAYTLAHQYALAGQMVDARRLFWWSFRENRSPLALGHATLAALGKRPFDAGMAAKRLIAGWAKNLSSQ